MEYTVIWTIDLDADSPEDAARKALTIQRDPNSWATHFEVRDPQGRTHEADLDYPGEPSRARLVHVLVPMEEGIVRGVEVFSDEKAAQQAEQDWLAERDLTEAKKREQSSDWGTGIAIWECPLKT